MEDREKEIRDLVCYMLICTQRMTKEDGAEYCRLYLSGICREELRGAVIEKYIERREAMEDNPLNIDTNAKEGAVLKKPGNN